MQPVDQTRLADDPKGGNCLAACFAAILNLTIEEVPDFDMRNDKGDWRLFYGEWLSKQGLELTCIYLTPDDEQYDDPDEVACVVISNSEAVSILAGPGPRGVGHAVVGRCGLNEYELLHDPHPSRAGLLAVKRIYLVSRPL